MPRGWWGAAPGGGGLPPLRGASGVRHCPSPSRLPSGAVSRGSATRVSRVRSVRAWGHPAPAPQRAPLRAGVARRGSGGRTSPGGCLPLLRGASDVRCSPSPDCPLTGRAVGVHYPRAVGAGVWVWGPNAAPLACMPCGGCVPRGWQGAVPGRGWPATVVRGVWCQALSLPRPPFLWGGQLVKHSGGGQPRQPPSFPWHARPQSHEIQDLNSNLGFSKEFWDPCLGHDTIWRPGQEMKVYVDNNKHVDK